MRFLNILLKVANILLPSGKLL